MANVGLTLFFTGLPSSGKSTIASEVNDILMARGYKTTVLDGDEVRTMISSELSFSEADRKLNLRRIGFIAGEITKHGGVAICCPIAPYEESRHLNRRLISFYGNYVEIFVDTPLSVCEQRDVKGLYKKARAGEIERMTGIDSPYERPMYSEIIVKTVSSTIEDCATQVIDYLLLEGYIDRCKR